MTPELAAALRAEIRLALEADGKSFDVNVARRVYDLAIAARDMCIAATSSTGEAIKAIADTGGATESLTAPGDPPSPVQATETFGVRMIRELIAAFRPTAALGAVGLGPSAAAVPAIADLPVWLNALAEARSHGLHDVAIGIEAKLQALGVLPIGAPASSSLFEEAPPPPGDDDGDYDSPPF